MRAVHPSPIRLVTILFTVAALAASAIGVASLPARAADDDVTWTVRTGSNDLGTGRSSFSYVVNPGSSVSDTMVVSNHGDTALTLSVYAADGFTNDSGSLDVRSENDSVGLGAWTSGTGDSITVKAGKSVEYPFTITVPDNATPGDYVGGLITALTQPDTEAGVNVDRRLGIRVALRVGGEITPSIAVEDAQLSWSGWWNPLAFGDATVSYRVHNTGNAVISASSSTTVSGVFGWFESAAVEAGQTPELLPGESWTVTATVPGVFGLLWITGASSVTPVTTDAAGSVTTLAVVEASAGAPAVPVLALLLLLVLAALVYGAIRLMRRSRATRRRREEERVAEAVERALAANGSPGSAASVAPDTDAEPDADAEPDVAPAVDTDTDAGPGADGAGVETAGGDVDDMRPVGRIDS